MLLIEGKRDRPRQMALNKAWNIDRIAKVQSQIDEVLKSLGKKETISVRKIVELNNSNKVSVFVKHCVVAIYKRLGKTTNENRAQKFIGAHNITYWMLRRHGYMRKDGFTLTGKGTIRNKYHMSEGKGGGTKTQLYAKLYNSVLKRKKGR